jgi:hypothetical protein
MHARGDGRSRAFALGKLAGWVPSLDRDADDRERRRVWMITYPCLRITARSVPTPTQ